MLLKEAVGRYPLGIANDVSSYTDEMRHTQYLIEIHTLLGEHPGIYDKYRSKCLFIGKQSSEWKIIENLRYVITSTHLHNLHINYSADSCCQTQILLYTLGLINVSCFIGQANLILFCYFYFYMIFLYDISAPLHVECSLIFFISHMEQTSSLPFCPRWGRVSSLLFDAQLVWSDKRQSGLDTNQSSC